MRIFHLPDLGEGLAEAEIREWHVKVGDVVVTDQPLVSMETAKAVVDVPSPFAGKIAALHGDKNAIIKTGSPLVTFDSEEGRAEAGSVVGSLESSTKRWDEGEVMVGSPKKSIQSIKATPAARVLAKQLHIQLDAIKPTGAQGLITPEDVKAYVKINQIENAPSKTESLHGVRRIMALTMAQSHHEVVPVTIFEDAEITHLPAAVDITVVLIQAIVSAAKLEPALNAWFDGKVLERKQFTDVHVGIAVDTPEGLFVPVIKNADKQSREGLRKTIDLYKKAIKERSLSPVEMQGASITLSNFGMIAGRYATPVIVPPAIAILACGKSREVALSRAGNIMSGRILPLSLTFDHRAATGGEAARFLGEIIRYLEAYPNENTV